MNERALLGSLRWDPYHLRRGSEFREFWKEHLNQKARNLLFLVGKGFDPRMVEGVREILGIKSPGVRDCILIDVSESQDLISKDQVRRASSNESQLNALFEPFGKIYQQHLPMWSQNGPRQHRVAPRKAASFFGSAKEFLSYTDIIVDISSMRRSVFFPLIGNILHHIDAKDDVDIEMPNLHIVVSENPNLDTLILPTDLDDEAYYIPGFGADLDSESTSGKPRLWIPILGEERQTHLERIYALVNPEETCPLLPSPSFNPRRGDNLVEEYRELLFDRWRVEPRNIVYASESNPFETYRQICRTVTRFDSALNSLGGCKTAISILSSKLLSIGALLAVIELRRSQYTVGVAHLEASSYDERQSTSAIEPTELFSLWLAGECYA